MHILFFGGDTPILILLKTRFRDSRCRLLAFWLAIVWPTMFALTFHSRASDAIALRDGPAPSSFFEVKVSFDVSGQLHDGATGEEEKGVTTPVKAAARLMYHEQPLRAAGQNRAAAAASCQAARYYQHAVAEIELGDTRARSQLRADRRQIMAATDEGEFVLTSPSGPLTRDEVDLLNVPASSTLIDRLMPGEPVKSGQSWQHGNQLLGHLFHLEAITVNEVKSRLEHIDGGLARVEIGGLLEGRATGAPTQLQITGHYHFDVKLNRVVWVQLAMRERRDIGDATPGLEVASKLRMLIRPLEKSPHLESSSNQSGLMAGGDEQQRLLHFASHNGGFELLHDRRWYVISDRPEGAVLRLVDQGDLLAQCSVSRLPDLPAGRQLGREEFQQDIHRALGEQLQQFEEVSEEIGDDGQRLLRVVVRGIVEGIPIRWIYHHVADPTGRRASLLFTLESELAARFGQSDRALVSALRFADRAATVGPAAKEAATH